MTKRTISLLMAFASICLLANGAPNEVETKGISLDLRVNYRFAYRDGSWVPVDVVVLNNDYDVDGYVEVRTFIGNRLQSPTYRVPAKSPKSSRKRFRLHCRLSQTTRVEAMLYHKGRAVQPVPAYLTVRPIDKKDMLALVMDKEPTDYSFLNVAVHTKQGDPTRLYREEITSDRIGMLPDHAPCYTPYDVIILGDIEPEKILPRHRALLARHVREGGVLVACIGENAQAYRRSWVMELAGVSIGGTKAYSGPDLAQLVLPPSDRAKAKAIREGMFTELKAVDDSVELRGEGATLATLRPYGRGYVAVVAIDAASKLLQDTPGYQSLWREMCEYRGKAGRLNFAAANSMYWERFPYLSGIRLFSKSSVMVYLWSYFFVAIVLNWALFSYLKRRELAWVCLVVLSFGFTAYALVYGTAGRAKQTSINELQLLHVPLQNEGGQAIASVRSTVSMLTARTSRHSIPLSAEFSLVEDVASIDLRASRYGGGPSLTDTPPFCLVQDSSPRLDNFILGASEMRMFHVITDAPVAGGITGTLQYNGAKLKGTLKNETGLPLANGEYSYVLVDGRLHRIQGQGDNIHIDLDRYFSQSPTMQGDQNSYRYYTARNSSQFENWAKARRKELNNAFLEQLLVGGPNNNSFDPSLGPYFIAWLRNPLPKTADSGMDNVQRTADALLIADIDVNHTLGARARRDLPVAIGEGAPRISPAPDKVVAEYAYNTRGRAGTNINGYIFIPAGAVSDGSSVIVVDLYWPQQREDLIFSPPGQDMNDWDARHKASDVADTFSVDLFSGPSSTQYEDEDYTQVRKHKQYRFDDWRSFYKPTSKEGRVPFTISSGGRREQVPPFTLTARLLSAN